MKNQKNLYIVIGIFFIIALFMTFQNNKKNKEILFADQEGNLVSNSLERFGLKTNTSKSSIDITKILSGGPGKDGIPALSFPKFKTVGDSDIKDDVRGIFVNINNEKKYYPYSILLWHEIVNDAVGGKDVAVTFCPLCGTGIVYDRNVNQDLLEFGVSGLLFESNLLMYDKKTESLWSQARGEAVIGDLNETKLTILPMQLISFAELKKKYPESLVLSDETGYSRNYDENPYGDYDNNDDIYFSVSVNDNRFRSKELMLVVPYEGKSIAIKYKEILENSKLEKEFENKPFIVNKNSEEIVVKVDGVEIPFYFEMWFSWATQHQTDGIVL